MATEDNYCGIFQGHVQEFCFGDSDKLDTKVRIDDYGQNSNLGVSEYEDIIDFCYTLFLRGAMSAK
jgi:hypothetical protein